MVFGIDIGLGSLGLDNILKPINNIFGSIGNLVKIIVGVILFFLIGVPLIKWFFRLIFGGSKQPQYPYPPPMGYSYPPMGYPPTPPPMGYSYPPMGYPPTPPPMSYPPRR